MTDRYPLRITDVVDLTGLGYDYIRRALLSGELEGLVERRLLRTSEEAVEAWLFRLRSKPRSNASSSSDEAVTHSPKPFQRVDPTTFGTRSL